MKNEDSLCEVGCHRCMCDEIRIITVSLLYTIITTIRMVTNIVYAGDQIWNSRNRRGVRRVAQFNIVWWCHDVVFAELVCFCAVCCVATVQQCNSGDHAWVEPWERKWFFMSLIYCYYCWFASLSCAALSTNVYIHSSNVWWKLAPVHYTSYSCSVRLVFLLWWFANSAIWTFHRRTADLISTMSDEIDDYGSLSVSGGMVELDYLDFISTTPY